MRILVYGFGPYRQFRRNITARIVKSLGPRPGLKKVVFPVRFQRRQFIDALKRHRPDVVLGLGQSARKKIEIEARAANRRRASTTARGRSISKRGPRWLATTLAPKADGSVGKSRNAGDYVCNYSMYVMLDYLNRSDSGVRFGFVHIPFDSDPAKAARLVTRMLAKLRAAQGNRS